MVNAANAIRCLYGVGGFPFSLLADRLGMLPYFQSLYWLFVLTLLLLLENRLRQYLSTVVFFMEKLMVAES